MNRYIRSAALIGSCLLGAACEQGTAPSESSFVPEAHYIQADSVSLVTRVSGLAWDPEALFMSLASCGPTCPMPPFLSEGIPLYQRAAVKGASMVAFDPVAGAPVGATATSDPIGFWMLPKVPSRVEAPFFVTSTGTGSLTDIPLPNPPFTPIPATQYAPTFTMRPLRTVYSQCTSQEAVQIGRNGILEAVAKYMSSKGQPTVVADLLNPTRFRSVVVIGAYYAGFPASKAPADGVAVEASVGQVYYIDWAPPNVPPASLRSARGFIVTETGSTPVGFAVVAVPATTTPVPTEIKYTIKDTRTDAAAKRPWLFQTVSSPPLPGVIGYLGLQAGYQPLAVPLHRDPPPPLLCLPE